MAIKIARDAEAGAVQKPRTIEVAFEQLDQLEEALNAQFSSLTNKTPGPWQLMFASQADPKGNVQIWRPKKGICTVSLTGALTALEFPAE